MNISNHAFRDYFNLFNDLFSPYTPSNNTFQVSCILIRDSYKLF